VAGKPEASPDRRGRALEEITPKPPAEGCKRAKISPAIGFHGLRHTYSSLVVMNSAPLLVVAKNLGHTVSGEKRKAPGSYATSRAETVRLPAELWGSGRGSPADL